MKQGPQTRMERLAAALRENLKRRKARARAVAEKESNSRGEEARHNTKTPDSQGTVKRIPCLTLHLRQLGKDD